MNRSARHLHSFVRALVSPWVLALPIAAVLGTIDYLGLLGYQIGYSVAVFFCYPIVLCVWITNTFVVPKLPVARSAHAQLWSHEILPTSVSAIFGALVGIGLMEYRVAGSIGDAVSVAQVLLFTLLFVALALAGAHALPSRDRQALREEDTFRRARSLRAELLHRMHLDRPALHLRGHR